MIENNDSAQRVALDLANLIVAKGKSKNDVYTSREAILDLYLDCLIAVSSKDADQTKTRLGLNKSKT